MRKNRVIKSIIIIKKTILQKTTLNFKKTSVGISNFYINN